MLPVVLPIFILKESLLIIASGAMWVMISVLSNPISTARSSEYDFHMAYRLVKYAIVSTQLFFLSFGIISYLLISSLLKCFLAYILMKKNKMLSVSLMEIPMDLHSFWCFLRWLPKVIICSDGVHG